MTRSEPRYVRYDPALAEPRADETALADALAETLVDIVRQTWEDEGRGLRAVHAKSHALLAAEVEIPELPPELAQGVFARPGRHRALMRLSTTPGDLLPDRVSTPRGIALRICDVPGERLEGAEHLQGQDVLMVNGPTFNAPDGATFLRNLKLLAKTTDRMTRTKQVISAVLRGTERMLEAAGTESTALKAMGGEPPLHPLGETYFSQLPLRFGEYIAKLQLVPASPVLRALEGRRLELADDNALQTALVTHFRDHDAIWELRAQLCTSLDDMPIEDATAEWSTDQSPFRTVAIVRAPRQIAWSETRSRTVDDGMGFSPWYGIQAHRPLGEIMRLRQTAYARSQAFRSRMQGRPLTDGCPFAHDD